MIDAIEMTFGWHSTHFKQSQGENSKVSKPLKIWV